MSGHKERNEITYENVDKFFSKRYLMDIAVQAAKTDPQNNRPTCNSIFSEQHISNSIFNDTCIKLLTYLNLVKSSGNTLYPYIYCGYANYWLNEQLRNENGESNLHTSNFFDILTSSSNGNIAITECKSYIYDLGDEIYKKVKILFTYYNHYNNYLIKKSNNPNDSCIHAGKCIDEYKKNIGYCPLYGEKFCQQLRTFKDELIRNMKSSNICAAEQNMMSQIDSSLTKLPVLDESRGFPVVIISISIIGTMVGVFLFLSFCYKLTPFGSLLRSLTRNVKKKKNILDEKENLFLFDYSGTSQNDSTNSDYNIPYNFVGN
ncbi:PIR protein [Plasmodium ovale]|uniref:PIR protein n=1 Tax=Plasmodium ovale TaxID=36330 RepID=A0A1C3KHX3_PLAOA|nr:PIR protein [Plasmodium ovale]